MHEKKYVQRLAIFLASLFGLLRALNPNSERDYIMPCAVKSSFKLVYREISFDKNWFSMLKIGDTSF
jgi:hypothetical protein